MVISEHRTYHFNKQRPFRILQLTDLHQGGQPHPQTALSMSAVIEHTEPDLVILTGDCAVSPACESKQQLMDAVERVVQPLVAARVPWAITLGNHDAEGIERFGMTKQELMTIYRAQSGNINRNLLGDIPGCGNDVLLVARQAEHPDLAIWLFDSMDYPTDEQKQLGISGYGWISQQQVNWYSDQSNWHLDRFEQIIPGLCFFHIPLPEYHEVFQNGAYTGEKNEDICAASVNSGLAAAMLEHNNIMGVYVGHDHVNTFVGDWHGIHMGYGGSIGYATYGLPEPNKHDLRGGRLFDIPLDKPKQYTSKYVLAKDLI